MRNDARYIEDSSVALAMYCDENGLTLDEGVQLAECIGKELENTAEDRVAYLPAETP